MENTRMQAWRRDAERELAHAAQQLWLLGDDAETIVERVRLAVDDYAADTERQPIDTHAEPVSL